jgi:hypothetical protein
MSKSFKQFMENISRRNFLKGVAGAAAIGMSSKSSGVVVNANRVIDSRGRSAANPYGNTDSMGNTIKNDKSKEKEEKKSDK